MPPALRLTYKPNKTLAMRFDLDRPVIEALGTGFNDGLSESRKSQVILDELHKGENKASGFFSDNFGGKRMLLYESYGSKSLIEKAVSNVILCRQVRIMVAMRLYELETSR